MFKKILGDSLLSSVGLLCLKMTGVFLGVFVARELGSESYAVYALIVSSLVLFATSPSNCLSILGAKFIARISSGKDNDGGVFFLSVLFGFVWVVVLFCFSAAGVPRLEVLMYGNGLVLFSVFVILVWGGALACWNAFGRFKSLAALCCSVSAGYMVILIALPVSGVNQAVIYYFLPYLFSLYLFAFSI